MDQITNWMQNNWYELGSLFAQFAFLFAGLWFAGKILRTMRATQQQMGALLRLSMTDGLEERSKISEATHEPEPTPSVVATSMLGTAAERPTPSPSAPRTAPARSSTSYAAFEKPARSEAPSFSEELSGLANTSAPTPPAVTATMEPPYEPTPYVAAPLTLPEDEHHGSPIAAAGRGVVKWLQTPIVNKQKGVSPLRKVVRWLQAPAR